MDILINIELHINTCIFWFLYYFSPYFPPFPLVLTHIYHHHTSMPSFHYLLLEYNHLTIGLTPAPTMPYEKNILGHSFILTYSFFFLCHCCCCCCLPTPMTLASGESPMFPLVVHQPASPSIWPAVQSPRRGLSTNPGVTMWCVCGCS